MLNNGMKRKETHNCNSLDRVVARSSDGDEPFYLFNHQVGGHKPLLRGAPGEVCKLAIPQELDFYQSIDSNVLAPLKPFIPVYCGTIEVDLYVYNKHTKSIKKQDEELRSSSCTCSNSQSLSPRQKATSSTSEKKRRRLSLEKGIAANPQTAAFSSSLWGKMKTTINDEIYEYLVLEDLTKDYKRPCILDIKMGTRQHGADAPAHKIISQSAKCEATTSFNYGLRLCGMQTFQVSTGQYLLRDKHWGRALNISDIKPALKLFFFNGRVLRIDALNSVIKRLVKLEEVIENIPGVRFWGASLLLIYEGFCEKEERSLSPKSCNKFDVRLIDFAHCHKDQKLTTSDEGCLLGLRNLIQYLSCIETVDPNDFDAGYYLDVFPEE